jgi:hypothetical protein
MNDPDAMPTLLAVFINWLPALVLTGVWLVYFKKAIGIQRAGVEEARRLANASERALALLEKRS